jgi:hypothetical protein
MGIPASIRTILTVICGRLDAHIPTDADGDVAATGGGPMAIGIFTTSL